MDFYLIYIFSYIIILICKNLTIFQKVTCIFLYKILILLLIMYNIYIFIYIISLNTLIILQSKKNLNKLFSKKDNLLFIFKNIILKDFFLE